MSQTNTVRFSGSVRRGRKAARDRGTFVVMPAVKNELTVFTAETKFCMAAALGEKISVVLLITPKEEAVGEGDSVQS